MHKTPAKALKALKTTNNFLVILNLVSKKKLYLVLFAFLPFSTDSLANEAKYLLLNQCSSITIA